jgi:hypothetical protein
MLLIIDQLNQLLSATVLIVAFSLLAYIAMQNWRNDIARALLLLLAGVVVVYGGDLLLVRASRPATIEFLGRAQWLGIAFVPAAYIHLANGLFSLSEQRQRALRARLLVYLAYLGSLIFFLLVALGTGLVVSGELPSGPVAQFHPGPLFWLFTLFFLISAISVLAAIIASQRSALTLTQRRRLNYLGATFAAPGIAAFPFLLLGAPSFTPTSAILLLQAIASLIVVVMITVMTYSVAFQGMLLPDRLIKQDFLRWWLYGPFVGISIVLFMQIVPLFEQLLGLPQNTLITFGVMLMTVLMPLFVSRIKPYIDALIYRQDQDEIDYLRSLPRSIFTRADLRTLLENSLAAICGALRVDTGFVVTPSNGSYTIRAISGPRHQVKRFITDNPLNELMPQLERLPPRVRDTLPPTEAFLSCAGFCLMPLYSPDGLFLGALAFAYAPEQLQRGGGLAAETRQMISLLAHQMELALTTVQMQQRIFDALRGLGPEMESLQQIASHLDQATPTTLTTPEGDLLLNPEFPQLVKDALTQFWGGPKLADSPLQSLRTVRQMLANHGGNRTRALQAVLRQAIANLRPDEQLDPSAQEWLLYNLLEGRFLQRKTVRDLANRLAMSESDFYRKQRVAIEEVARQLALMEDGVPQ